MRILVFLSFFLISCGGGNNNAPLNDDSADFDENSVQDSTVQDSISINKSISINIEQKRLSKAWEASIKNYINYISKKNNLNLSNVPYSKELKNIWIICIHDLNKNECDRIFDSRLKTVKLNRIDLIKIP